VMADRETLEQFVKYKTGDLAKTLREVAND
jgi:hypothetical protein